MSPRIENNHHSWLLRVNNTLLKPQEEKEQDWNKRSPHVDLNRSPENNKQTNRKIRTKERQPYFLFLNAHTRKEERGPFGRMCYTMEQRHQWQQKRPGLTVSYGWNLCLWQMCLLWNLQHFKIYGFFFLPASFDMEHIIYWRHMHAHAWNKSRGSPAALGRGTRGSKEGPSLCYSNPITSQSSTSVSMNICFLQ